MTASGETAEMALGRELRDELGVDAVVTGDAFPQVRGRDFRMDIWVIDKCSGEPANVDLIEPDALAWLNHDETAALTLAHPQLSALLGAALR